MLVSGRMILVPEVPEVALTCQGFNLGPLLIFNVNPPPEYFRPLSHAKIDASVSWLKDGEPIKIDGENYELTSQGDLIVNTVDKTAAGNYTCRASSVVGSRLSPPASVFVYSKFSDL